VARDIDDVIDYVRGNWRFNDTIKQLIVNRLDPAPSQEELDQARNQVRAKQAEDAANEPSDSDG
jgi:hypothetical protein